MLSVLRKQPPTPIKWAFKGWGNEDGGEKEGCTISLGGRGGMKTFVNGGTYPSNYFKTSED